ncbi:MULTISPECIES: hypothetical protein [unclassified Streptomyces]|uniref:hypothetical protein n=1 Tax=unclassified Streptomyces TaxID=2593676 RepID=UPI0004BD3B78|nr:MULTISPECIES: hypothetical protein [unclassified Streptomyces]
MRYATRAERGRIAGLRVLLWAGALVASPVLLVVGRPIRRRYLRHLCRDGAPPLIDKRQGWVSAHWFVVTHPLLRLLCLPPDVVARRVLGRG